MEKAGNGGDGGDVEPPSKAQFKNEKADNQRSKGGHNRSPVRNRAGCIVWVANGGIIQEIWPRFRILHRAKNDQCHDDAQVGDNAGPVLVGNYGRPFQTITRLGWRRETHVGGLGLVLRIKKLKNAISEWN